MLSPLAKANLYLNLFAIFKVPLIWTCRPKLKVLNEDKVVVSMPLTRKNRNHLNSMYFGALAVGSDVAGGFMAMSKAKQRGVPISLAFKGVQAEFLKRPEAEVEFVCNDGRLIDQMLDDTIASGKRINETVNITVLCPSLHGDEPMAHFSLVLSVKAKST